jgi:Patatin-like phospholipase
VTLARRVRWFDPDEPNILLRRSVRVLGFPIGEAFIPRYERIDGKPREDVSRLLVGTASLPEGIFPAFRLDGEDYVDGGAADNTPVYPLIEIEPCDEIWILTVNRPEKKGGGARTRYLREWMFIERRLRVSSMGADVCKKLFHRYVPEHGLYTAYTLPRVPRPLVPEREPNAWPPRIVEIAPRAPLGGFFSGTLNFRQAYVQRLFDQGYADGRDAITTYLEGDPARCYQTGLPEECAQLRAVTGTYRGNGAPVRP